MCTNNVKSLSRLRVNARHNVFGHQTVKQYIIIYYNSIIVLWILYNIYMHHLISIYYIYIYRWYMMIWYTYFVQCFFPTFFPSGRYEGMRFKGYLLSLGILAPMTAFITNVTWLDASDAASEVDVSSMQNGSNESKSWSFTLLGFDFRFDTEAP